MLTNILWQFLNGIASRPEIALPPAPGVDLVAETQDRYTLNSLHATGGIGRVWLAHVPRWIVTSR